MSILIKGLHLPTERLYPLHLTIYSDGNVFCGHGIGKRSYEAVEVPTPHGDLIDSSAYRDDFMAGVYELCEDDPDNYRANSIIDLFDGAPVYIPAEEEE